jgi:hypothetical protein
MSTSEDKTCEEMAADLSGWPNCPIPDCPNKICLSLDSDKCWPHTVGLHIDWAKGLSTEARERRSRAITAEYLRKRAADPRKDGGR